MRLRAEQVNAHGAGPSASWPGGSVALGLILAVLVLAGCRLGGRVVPSPLSYQQQKRAILGIAPVGTARERAVRKLTEAGIEGEFGISRSIYYCDLWKRQDGQRWHLDVALLFDQSGQVYQARPAQSATGIAGDELRSTDTGSTFDGAGLRASRFDSPHGSGTQNNQPSSAEGSSPPTRNSARNGRRTPWTDASDVR